MPNLMQWRSTSDSDHTKILWTQQEGQQWQPYNATDTHVPDFKPIMGMEAEHSKGWAAMQHYRKLGYTLIASDPAEGEKEQAEFQAQAKLMPLSGMSEEQRSKWAA